MSTRNSVASTTPENEKRKALKKNPIRMTTNINNIVEVDANASVRDKLPRYLFNEDLFLVSISELLTGDAHYLFAILLKPSGIRAGIGTFLFVFLRQVFISVEYFLSRQAFFF